MDEERSAFALRLEQALKDKGITQKELAARAEVTEAAVSHYIKGDRTPRSSVLARIAVALGTTSDYLMEGVSPSALEEFGRVKRLIARNVATMSPAQKKEIINLLIND